MKHLKALALTLLFLLALPTNWTPSRGGIS